MNAIDKRVDAVYRRVGRSGNISFGAVALCMLVLLEDWLGPVKFSLGRAYQICFALLAVAFLYDLWATWCEHTYIPNAPPEQGRSWGDDPDATERLGILPIAPWQPYDPNMTQPIDPEADIPTVVRGYPGFSPSDDTMDILPRELWDG